MRSKITAAVVVPVVLGLLGFGIAHTVNAAAPRKSQNGWTVVEQDGTQVYQVPGSKVRLRLRKGDVAVVLLDVAAWFDRDIEDIDKGKDDWGHSVRKIEGSSTYSNHASGTAIDLNAQQHPMGVATSKGLTKAEIDKIHAQLRSRYKNVIRWGGDYKGRPDAMHFEINKDAAAVKSLADALRKDDKPPAPAPTTTAKPPAPTTTAKPSGPTTKPSGPTTTTPAAPTTAAPAEDHSVEGEGEHTDGEQIGPVEEQAPTEATAPATAASAVKATPLFTG